MLFSCFKFSVYDFIKFVQFNVLLHSSNLHDFHSIVIVVCFYRHSVVVNNLTITNDRKTNIKFFLITGDVFN